MTSTPLPQLVIISGPSGIGKNRLIADLLHSSRCRFEVPYTTRPSRSDEVHGREYRFLSSAEFQRGIQQRFFFEWDYTLSAYYGFADTLIADQGQQVITHALARMALRIKGRFARAALVFLMPKSENQVLHRLRTRSSSAQEVEQRMGHVREEIVHSSLFDHILTVDGADEASRVAELWRSLGIRG